MELALQLHALRSGISTWTREHCNHQQPIQHEFVTHVSGTIYYLCLRAVQLRNGAPDRVKMTATSTL